MRAVCAILALLLLAVACSSVPDVQYLDLDAGTGGSSGSSGASGSSGTSGAGGKTDASADVRCPGSPPPAAQGVCCGVILCVGCSATQCSRCEREGCKDGEVCCARNAVSVDCRPASSCK